MSEFKLHPLGVMMEPEPGNLKEVEGVLNRAAARGPDGELYLFRQLVAKEDYSRIGIARVRFNDAGDPVGARRILKCACTRSRCATSSSTSSLQAPARCRGWISTSIAPLAHASLSPARIR